MAWLGNFDFGSTVFFGFTTVNASGGLSALTSAAVSVYRNSSTAPSATGLTLISSFNNVVGLNRVQIDQSTTGFFASAGNFMAVISSGGTVGESLAGYIVAEWGLRSRFMLSSAGLETVSTAGLETLSSAGIETVSTAGLETVSTSILESAIWDRVLTGATHNITNSAGRRLRQIEAGFVIHEATGFGDAATFNTVTLDAAASTRDDFYNHTKIVITDGTGVEQERIIHNYVGATKVATVAPPWIVTPSSTDVFEIEPGVVHAETGWATVKVGIVQVASQTTMVTLDGLGSTVDDYYNGDILKIDFDGSTGAPGQSRIIEDYDGSSKVAFLHAAFSQAPTTAAEYIIEDGLCVISTVGLETLSTAGLETLSSAGLETASSLVDTVNLTTAAAVQVKAEVVQAINVDTYEEPGLGIPTTAPSLVFMSRLVYSALKNQIIVSASAKSFYGDANNFLYGKVLSQDTTGSTGIYTEAGASTST